MHDLACHRSTGITELIDPAHVHNETQRIAASLGIDIAFHAEHLSTGQSVGWQDDEYRTMASTMKLPTAIALLNRVDKGELSLDAMHTFTQKDMRMGGWLTEPLVKRQGTIALSTFSVIDAAMRVSDNAAWLKMVELCGGIEYVQAFLAEKGIEGVRSTDDLFAGYPELLQSLGYDRVMAPSLLKAEHRPVVFEKQLTPERDACTPRGMVGLLKGLFRGELVSAANYINQNYSGHSFEDVRQRLQRELHEIKQDMMQLMNAALDAGNRAMEEGSEPYVISGERNLLTAQDLSHDLRRLRQLFELFEHKTTLLQILDLSLRGQGVQVFIGGESGVYAPDDVSKAVDTWHTDGIGFDIAILLSEPSSFEGGEFQFFLGTRAEAARHLDARPEDLTEVNSNELPEDGICSVAFPAAGYALFQNGDMVVHRVNRLRRRGERITLVPGYVARDVRYPDPTRDAVAHWGEPGMTAEFARHKAWLARAKLDSLIERLPLTDDVELIQRELRWAIADVEKALRLLQS